jgi:hypothetical protein
MREQLRKVRHTPRMSAPKMGEYLGVPAHRRERILREQKYPPTILLARYTDANNLIRATLLSSGDVSARLAEKAKLMAGRPMPTKYRADANDCCVQAVHRFARLYEDLGLEGTQARLSGTDGFPILIEHVTISVAPTVLLTRRTRLGTEERGALLLVYRKEAALDAHGAEAVAELMRQALVIAGHVNVRPKLCIVVDVFSGLVVHAPLNHKRIDSELRSACREIAVRWGTLLAA